MSKKKLRYIINPASGANHKVDLVAMANEMTDKLQFDFEIVLTKAAKHATELAKEAAGAADIVIAVGGDGSVNEVARGLLGSKTALAIIPMGSGNGMARHLKIPIETKAAFNLINNGRIDTIDTMQVNNEFAIGTIGIGFDAHIAHLFANAGTRGYGTYVKLVLTEFYKYKPVNYHITVDGKSFDKECFLLTFANSSQFGNNAVIAPYADVQDGIIDVSMMKKFPFFLAPHLIWRLMNNSIHKSRFFQMKQGRSISVRNQRILQGHIDGEPVTFTGDIHVKILPMSLNVLVP
jgi:diacylglycerol kinase (ATP)